MAPSLTRKQDESEEESFSESDHSSSYERQTPSKKTRKAPTPTKTSTKRSKSSPSSMKIYKKDSEAASANSTPNKVALPELIAFRPVKEDRALFLDGYEGYFEQNKLKNAVSTGSMTNATDLEHSEFLQITQILNILHSQQRDVLKSYYESLFNQWFFQLSEGFNMAFYGLGSKRALAVRFISEYVLVKLSALGKETKSVVLNGYNPEASVRELMKQIGSIFYNGNRDYPLNPRSAIEFIRKEFKDLESPQLVVLVNNIDGEGLRTDRSQELLSRLASIPQIWMCVTMDHVNTPVMWDSGVLSQFNLLWHETTTFDPYLIETSFKNVLALGKSSKFIGSKGAEYVLTSLTSNARKLYHLLIARQIKNMNADHKASKGKKGTKEKAKFIGKIRHGVPFKELYEACLDEFITSNEISFRTVLGEFCEHKMAVLSKDNSGTEFVYIPFNIEELEKLATSA
ncbi:unnamed protein product [Kuraishia capsulata CBS 1993]|uniref:Origin recognition complex subunit 2 n=1 Tax=Kuraishia capsulata CBS 1993 TaxID=1382522 RepID=W6MGG4_9ASCO|nr:uncharacterized protein KUCA_T00001156001 [Kuraishia capsulata CBS 1993]CDK25189.1 unnamed protein product [Kuraishia capsulata CBS 1993]